LGKIRWIGTPRPGKVRAFIGEHRGEESNTVWDYQLCGNFGVSGRSSVFSKESMIHKMNIRRGNGKRRFDLKNDMYAG